MLITSSSLLGVFEEASLGIKSKAIAFVEGSRTKPNARAFLGLSKNSKMPCYTLSIPARITCPRGDLLADIADTVCSICYALKGHDAMAPSINAKDRRLALIKLALSNPSVAALWLEAFVIALEGEEFFRWHASGDIFSPDYASLIRSVTSATPKTKHWIPTREQKLAYMFRGLPNVAFRVSDDMIDQHSNKYTGLTSGVHTGIAPVRGQACSAPLTNGSCDTCRACWSLEDKHVSYKQH